MLFPLKLIKRLMTIQFKEEILLDLSHSLIDFQCFAESSETMITNLLSG
jgi:hypothetical protein